MQNTYEFLRCLASLGISVSLQGNRLKVVPKELLNDEIREEIKKHRDEIVEALSIVVPEQSREEAKGIDFNTVAPNSGSQLFVEPLQGTRDATRIERSVVTKTEHVTLDRARRTEVKLPSPVALAWLKKNKEALRCNGWTAAELFRRNKSKQGLAWIGIWQRIDLEPLLLAGGVIQFFLKDRGTIQTARPKDMSPPTNVR